MCVDLFLLLAEIEVPYPYALVVRTGVKEFSTGMQGEVADPVIMTCEGMEKLASLA